MQASAWAGRSCLPSLEWSGRVTGAPLFSGETAFAQQLRGGGKPCPGICPGAHRETSGGWQSSAGEGRNAQEAKVERPKLTAFLRPELEHWRRFFHSLTGVLPTSNNVHIYTFDKF